MNKSIYVLTDCNRTCLQVGMTNDLYKTVKTYKELSAPFVDARLKTSRLVHHETFPTEAAAVRRFRELSTYTRMQKERLIRKYNPNWVDLGLLNTRHTAQATNLPNVGMRY